MEFVLVGVTMSSESEDCEPEHSKGELQSLSEPRQLISPYIIEKEYEYPYYLFIFCDRNPWMEKISQLPEDIFRFNFKHMKYLANIHLSTSVDEMT